MHIVDFQTMCFATYSVFVFSHAEDLDPEEGEGDVDSQLSGQGGGDIFQFSVQPKKKEVTFKFNISILMI